MVYQCHYCDKNNHNTADFRAIAKFKQKKKACFEAKSGPGKKFLAFLFEEFNALKGQLKPESILSTEISRSIILEAYTLAISPFIKTDYSNTTTWSKMGGKFTTTKTEICL
jgi:hypothetical protein